MDTHMDTWQHETFESAQETAWLRWIAAVESISGHSADGELRTDGYSMDTYYEMWEAGMSAEESASTILRVCYHPRSCLNCQGQGMACGRHIAGRQGHERCTGAPYDLTGFKAAAL